MTCLLSHDGRMLDLDRILDGVELAALEDDGDGPSTVVGFLLGLRFGVDERMAALALLGRLERLAAEAFGDGAVPEEFEELFRTMVGHIVEAAVV